MRVTRLSHRLARVVRSAARFPRRLTAALTGGWPAGGFDLNDGAGINRLLAAHGLPPLAAPTHTVAFRDGRLGHGEKVYEVRDDVRRAIPLALTPAGRETFLDWFLRGGREQTDVGFPDLLRLLFEHDAAPDRGLVGSYLLHPDWQARHPAALTPAGWGPFKRWVAAEYRVSGRWLRRAALPTRFAAPPEQKLGANVLALFRHPSGLQQCAVAVVDALANAGVSLALRDIPTPFHRDGRPRAGFEGLEQFPVTILNLGLDVPALGAYRAAGLYPRPGVYRVAIWLWELEHLPAGWLDRGRDVDEIWAPTEFIATALRPLGRPVTTILTPVRLPAFPAKPKAAFGLDPDRFTFLFVFDMNSRLARKNPLGLIRAFRLAFRPDEPVDLVLKVSPQDRFYADWWRELRTAAAAAGARLVDRLMPREELLGLMNAADAYVSLHRSEGIGLTMAEAMLMGKPVIATGYSGNLAFMTPDNSYLVRYERVEIAEDIPPYPKGCVWAEPSVEHAAKLMRRVVDRPAEARAVAARGRADAERLFSPEAAGQKMAARLAEITRGVQ
ncbi:MAG: hypothetical protein JWO38_8242 [Gemmataceae bacterium]|nr:hypothetical protein [Gemmataceae bacterium]